MTFSSTVKIGGFRLAASGTIIVAEGDVIEIALGDGPSVFFLEINWLELEGKPDNQITLTGIAPNRQKLSFINVKWRPNYTLTKPIYLSRIDDNKFWLMCSNVQVGEAPKTWLLIYNFLVEEAVE